MRPVLKRTFREQIADEIRDAVLKGQLAPGSQIVEADLAARFGVSRGPLREALRHLIEEGLLVTVPYTGTHVVSLSLRDITEIMTLRAELEVHAFKLAWDRRDHRFEDEINERHERLLSAIRSEDGQAGIMAELALHSFPYEASGHGLLLSVWESMKLKMRIYWVAYHRAHGRNATTIDAHRRYVELACGSDFEALSREVRLHVLQGFNNIGDFIAYQEKIID